MKSSENHTNVLHFFDGMDKDKIKSIELSSLMGDDSQSLGLFSGNIFDNDYRKVDNALALLNGEDKQELGAHAPTQPIIQ